MLKIERDRNISSSQVWLVQEKINLENEYL